MEEVMRSGWLSADFFTHSYRISGQVDVRRKGLFEMLSDPMTAFVQLEDAYVSPVDRPGEITASYSASNIVKANLTLVIVAQRDEVIPRKQSYGMYAGAHLQRVFLTLPALEVQGYLRLSARVDLRRILSLEAESFFAVLDGRANASIRPDVVFTGGGFLVNKQHVGAFCLSEED